jgi:NADH-quinone oxidoreductase subunit N
MTRSDLIHILPLVVMVGGALALLIAVAVRRSLRAGAIICTVTLAAALLALIPAARGTPMQVTELLLIDGYSLFFTGLILAAALVVALLSVSYWRGREGQREEYYLLLLTATIGAVAMVDSAHYVSFFLGLEILSISFFTLVAYWREVPARLEAGIKYLLLSGASSAFLLFGSALIYAELGSLRFRLLAEALAGTAPTTLVIAGAGLFLVGLSFKLSLVPFHLWSPDVFQGAPAPVSAFIATVSKGAVFALLLRYAFLVELYRSEALILALAVISALSMLAGNLLALRQTSLKRLMGYSSIAHMGYLLVAFLAAGKLAVTAVSFYLVSYFIATLGIFGVMILRSRGEAEADQLEEYQALARENPGLAVVMAAGMISLAGIPLTVGFLGKFYVLHAGIGGGLVPLAVILVVGSVIGLFYYLRVVVGLFRGERQPALGLAGLGGGAAVTTGGVVVGLLTAALVFLGIYPAPLSRLIERVVTGLFG